MHGDNFDGSGFVAGLRQQGYEPAGMDVLMVGSGGAARAIALALCEAGVGRLRISNRTAAKADTIVAALADLAGHHQAETATGHDGAGVDMIVNTTSLGLHDGDALPITLDAVDTATLIAEIIMIPERTDWLADAEARGLTTHYGRHMLDCQLDLIGGFIGAL